jgi:hypothetical protein
MEPVTIAIGGGLVAGATAVGRIIYNYGKDRKELNGTVARVKSIEIKLDQHIKDENHDFRIIRKDITEIGTKVDLLIDHKIKDD